MKKLIDVFKKVTSIEVTKTNKDCYTIWLINEERLEVVLMHGDKFRDIVTKDNSSLRDFYIEKRKDYWYVTEVRVSFKIFFNNLQTQYLELSRGIKVHLKEMSGTYEVVDINRNKTVLITCNSWKNNPNKPDIKLVKLSDIHCLAGGLVNFRFLNKTE